MSASRFQGPNWRFAIYDLRFTICDLRFAIYDLRFAIYDLRFTIYDLRFAGLLLTAPRCGFALCGATRLLPLRGSLRYNSQFSILNSQLFIVSLPRKYKTVPL